MSNGNSAILNYAKKAANIVDQGAGQLASAYVDNLKSQIANKDLWNQAVQEAGQNTNNPSDILSNAVQIYKNEGGSFTYALAKAGGQQAQAQINQYIDQGANKAASYAKQSIPLALNYGAPYAYSGAKKILSGLWNKIPAGLKAEAVEAAPLAEDAAIGAAEVAIL